MLVKSDPTPLIRPNFHGPLVVVLKGFHRTVVFYFAQLSFSILPYDRMTVAIAWYKEPIKMVYSVPYGMNIKQNDSSEMKTSLSPSKGKPISRQ